MGFAYIKASKEVKELKHFVENLQKDIEVGKKDIWEQENGADASGGNQNEM
jgi:hypothetical protein